MIGGGANTFPEYNESWFANFTSASRLIEKFSFRAPSLLTPYLICSMSLVCIFILFFRSHQNALFKLHPSFNKQNCNPYSVSTTYLWLWLYNLSFEQGNSTFRTCYIATQSALHFSLRFFCLCVLLNFVFCPWRCRLLCFGPVANYIDLWYRWRCQLEG